jgi:uncharacterized protein YjdB
VATVTVTPNPATVPVDSTLQLTAAVEDADGNQLSGRAVAWSSNAVAQATVDANGLVTGVTEGAVTITAISEGKTGTSSITVSDLSLEWGANQQRAPGRLLREREWLRGLPHSSAA